MTDLTSMEEFSRETQVEGEVGYMGSELVLRLQQGLTDKTRKDLQPSNEHRRPEP